MLVSLLRQLTDDLISYLDCRAVAHDHPCLFLQRTQLIVQSIIFQVAHDLCIFHIIFLCSIVELLYKFFDSGYLAVIVISAYILILLDITGVTLINIFIDIPTNIFHAHPRQILPHKILYTLFLSQFSTFYPNIYLPV